jgi:predicted nucleotidyltransferase component of viral defense system
VLDSSRSSILDKLSKFKDEFYLAGGTALALQIGHRISVDFDFFTTKEFDNFSLLKKLDHIFVDESILVVQNEV